jgi:sugar phosphate isomerase/epimerase
MEKLFRDPAFAQTRRMILTGIGDEAANTIDGQIRAHQQLGWKWIEMRGVEVPGHAKANFHDIPDAAFDIAVGKLKDAGLGVYCFGSTIMNWAKTVATPFDVTLAEVSRCIPRMQRTGTKFVRIMSFKPCDDEAVIPADVFNRVREVTQMFLDAGIQPVHENCMNYGGMSWQHALELLEKVPGLKWVFDTANPVFNADRAKPKPWSKQDAWEFYTHVKPHTGHVHIKDARWNPAKNDADYTMPGEGDGSVRAVIKDLLASGYTGAFSIEPHVAVVFHDATVQASADQQFNSYVEYGRALEKLIADVQTELRAKAA